MKYFSFKWLILCILLPIVGYGVTVQALEHFLQYRYARGVEDSYIGDTAPLLNGSRRLKDAIRENIDRYLKERVLPAWGVEVEVLVSTHKGLILYPGAFEDLDPSMLADDNQEVAGDNFSILNEPIKLSVNVTLAFFSPISLAILSLYISVSVGVLYRFYRLGIKSIRAEENTRDEEMRRLRERADLFFAQLESLERERKEISSELKLRESALQLEKEKAATAEAEMFGEIVSLDQKLKDTLHKEAKQLREIDELREKILAYEAELNRNERQRIKEADSIGKRFKAVYKNIMIDDRAVEGFVDLPDDMQIKAEELIHRLNDEPDQVPIKRKVFGKKGRETVLEVLFSYNGRLYFRRLKNQMIEVVIIGTKNTQLKDLEYIDNIPRKG